MAESNASQAGQMGYLTIRESAVRRGESQRCPGLHTETPRYLRDPGRRIKTRQILKWGAHPPLRGKEWMIEAHLWKPGMFTFGPPRVLFSAEVPQLTQQR